MRPFSVKLSYNGKPWVTIDLEVGHNEIGDADKPDFVSPEDANAVLEKPGFSAARPDSHHGAAPPNRPEAARCERAQQHAGSRPHRFAAARQGLRRRLLRRASNLHEAVRLPQDAFWPPTIAGGQEWATIYADQLPDGNLIPEVDDAIAWANSLINWDRYRPIAQHLHQKTRHAGTLTPDTAKHPGAAGNTPGKNTCGRDASLPHVINHISFAAETRSQPSSTHGRSSQAVTELESLPLQA